MSLMNYADYYNNVETPLGFQEWLHTKEIDAVVGFGNLGYDCPYTNFLKESGYSEAVVGYGGIFLENESMPVPDWLKTFMSYIDDIFDQEVITAQDALDTIHHKEVFLIVTDSIRKKV